MIKDYENEMVKFQLGTYGGLGNKLHDMGYTVTLKRPFSHTQINFEDFGEAMDTIDNHVENYNKYVEIDKGIDKYCSENSWTRSGT